MKLSKAVVATSLVIPILVFAGGWSYVNHVASTYDGDVSAKWFEIAGQYGDKFGFVNALLSMIGVFLLFLNWQITRSQIKELRIEKIENDKRRNEELILASLDKLIETNNTLKNSLVLLDRTGRHSPENGTAFDFLIGDIISNMHGQILLNGILGGADGEKLSKSDIRGMIDDSMKHIPRTTSINDMERYINSANQIGVLLTKLNSVDRTIIISKIYSCFTAEEILFLVFAPHFPKFSHNTELIEIYKIVRMENKIEHRYAEIFPRLDLLWK